MEGVLAKELVKIHLKKIHHWHESIPRRIEAVIAAKGEPTPHKNIFRGFFR
jgi:hypothetical protein